MLAHLLPKHALALRQRARGEVGACQRGDRVQDEQAHAVVYDCCFDGLHKQGEREWWHTKGR